MYEINFELPSFLLSLFCFIYCLTVKRRQYIMPKSLRHILGSQHIVFLLMLLSNIISSISSVIGVYLTNASFPHVAFWQYLFHAFYFFFHATLSVTFTLYIVNVTGTNLKWRKITKILFVIPYIISELIILTNSFTKWAFYMDSELIYHRGPLMIILYAIGGFYVVLGLIVFLKYNKAISKTDRIAVFVYIIIATAGIVTQAIKSSYLVELFCESIACLTIMMVLEEKSGHIEPITGLLNRVAFEDTNRRLIAANQHYHIVLIKICNFEKMIKKFGEREADAFLIAVSAYLTRKADVVDVYCYRREDFAVIFKDVDNELEIRYFIDDVLKRFAGEWNLESVSIKTEVVLMHIRVPEDIKSLNDLDSLISFDYQKKKIGSYVASLKEIEEITKLGFYEDELKKAIIEKRLQVKFQPIWSCKEKCVVSAEALLRVDSDALRDISPEVYIPIAEKTGMIKDIGIFVFEQVCIFLTDERIKNTNIKFVEVNLSPYQFAFPDLIDDFENVRIKYNIPTSKIVFEITETTASLEQDDIKPKLAKFQELGYAFSLDDFGTGFSNLIRIIHSNYENIKIDKSILWGISKGGEDKKSLQSMVNFIKSLGSDIVQEGVETKEELDLVVECGCDYIQGFYFSPAITRDEFFAYLEANKE